LTHAAPDGSAKKIRAVPTPVVKEKGIGSDQHLRGIHKEEGPHSSFGERKGMKAHQQLREDKGETKHLRSKRVLLGSRRSNESTSSFFF
jgi:hypothetical protein